MRASRVLPWLSKLLVSRAKLEKVVKPPQIPTLRKRSNVGCSAGEILDVIRTISRQPSKLTLKVDQGKPDGDFRGIKLNRKRRVAPIKPPQPTISISVNLIMIHLVRLLLINYNDTFFIRNNYLFILLILFMINNNC